MATPVLVALTRQVDFRSIEGTVQSVFTITIDDSPGLAMSDETDPAALDVIDHGRILSIVVEADSDDFDISLRDAASVVPPSINEIYQVSNIDTTDAGHNLGILFSSGDNSGKLYLVIKNNSATDVLNVLVVHLFIAQM